MLHRVCTILSRSAWDLHRVDLANAQLVRRTNVHRCKIFTRQLIKRPVSLHSTLVRRVHIRDCKAHFHFSCMQQTLLSIAHALSLCAVRVHAIHSHVKLMALWPYGLHERTHKTRPQPMEIQPRPDLQPQASWSRDHKIIALTGFVDLS